MGVGPAEEFGDGTYGKYRRGAVDLRVRCQWDVTRVVIVAVFTRSSVCGPAVVVTEPELEARRRKEDRRRVPDHELADQRIDVNSRREHMGLAECAGEVCALRGDPPSIDCWFWICRTRPCKMAQRTRSVRGDPSRHRRSCSAIDGLVDHRH